MNSGRVVHSLTRRAYSSSCPCLVWVSARPAAQAANTRMRESLIKQRYPYTVGVGNSSYPSRRLDSMRTALLLAAAMLVPLYGQQRDVIKVDFSIRDTG